MNLKSFFLFIILLCAQSFALDFVPGAGSKFIMSTQGQKVDLSIYVASRNDSSLNIEMHFGAGGIIPVNMWQQFEFGLQGKNQPLKVSKGYIKLKSEKKPEVMNAEFMKHKKGVQVHDFLFSKKEDIEKYFIGSETVEVPAGSVRARHYRKISDGQTIDFWIAESVGPISLVKLQSKSEKDSNANYSIELSSLLRNVTPTIDPKQASAMSEETQKLLGKTPK